MIIIKDRTEADVQAVATLKAKFQVVDSVGSYIQVQDLGSGKYLVFTGTQAEYNSYMAGMKGAWNYTDLNRIAAAMKETASAFNAVGIETSVVAKNTWSMGDFPTQSDATTFLEDLATLKTTGEVGGTSVASLDGLTYETANRIEEIIYLAFLKSQSINGNFNHCGALFCGAEGVLS